MVLPPEKTKVEQVLLWFVADSTDCGTVVRTTVIIMENVLLYPFQKQYGYIQASGRMNDDTITTADADHC